MKSLPKLRADLSVFHQQQKEGRPRVVLKDPVTQKYFRLSNYEFRLLESLDGSVTVEEALSRLRNAGRYYSPENARIIIENAARMGLILGTDYTSSRFLLGQKSKVLAMRKAKYLSSIYFLFIPILNPDKFLEKTLWIFRLLANRWLGLAAALLAPGAVYLLISGLPKLELEYLFFFNWQNLLLLWATIALTKLIHEFSHGYVAKNFGLNVPEMGIGFLIFFPCLYCNTTDAWQLADRKQRAAIAAAGIMAEAVLAIGSTYVWYFSKPGLINSLAFYLMAVSFVSTVLFNGNPLLKFDGYFMLIDFLGMPNLAGNSLKYLKYLFLNRVLGRSSVPNPAHSSREASIFCAYGISAFLYRILLYSGIVIGVYYRFDKVIGICLALLALGIFVLRPIFMGVANMYKNRSEIRPRPMGVVIIVIILAGILVPLSIPWSSKSVYPCFVGSSRIQKLTVPLHTLVEEVFVRDGMLVEKGQRLFQLDSSQLSLALEQKRIQREIVENEIQMLLLDKEHFSEAEGKAVELQQVDAEIVLLEEQLRLAEASLVAPFDGVITSLDDRLQEGFQPGEGVIVGDLQSLKQCIVHALVPAAEIHKVAQGQEVEIRLPIGTGRILRKRIDTIKSYSEKDLRNSPFSSRFGGELATEEMGEKQRDAPLEAQYDCSVHILNEDDTILLGMTGRLAVLSPPQSIIAGLYETMMRTFNRESFF
jgi:putative peptide zinc metalloprotease protein